MKVRLFADTDFGFAEIKPEESEKEVNERLTAFYTEHAPAPYVEPPVYVMVLPLPREA